MHPFLEDFLLSLIPLFVAIDPLGLLPLFLSLTEELTPHERRNVALQACATAFGVAVLFLFLGQAVFRILGIRMEDFLVAGGILLFCFALTDLLAWETRRPIPLTSHTQIAAVPLGTPLITGPGTLAATLLLSEKHGSLPTVPALAVCILVVAVLFLTADRIVRCLGTAGTRTASRIASILLAAYAVMMIRRGVSTILTELFANVPPSS